MQDGDKIMLRCGATGVYLEDFEMASGLCDNVVLLDSGLILRTSQFTKDGKNIGCRDFDIVQAIPIYFDFEKLLKEIVRRLQA